MRELASPKPGELWVEKSYGLVVEPGMIHSSSWPIVQYEAILSVCITSLIIHSVVIWKVWLRVPGQTPTHVPVHIGIPLITVATQVMLLKAAL